MGAAEGVAEGAGVAPTAASMASLKAWKLMDPTPEAGSHPATAENPVLQHVAVVPVEARQLLAPDVTSLTKLVLVEAYSRGLTNPRVGLPAARRAALARETRPAMTGAEAEVPATPLIHWPVTRTR